MHIYTYAYVYKIILYILHYIGCIPFMCIKSMYLSIQEKLMTMLLCSVPSGVLSAVLSSVNRVYHSNYDGSFSVRFRESFL